MAATRQPASATAARVAGIAEAPPPAQQHRRAKHLAIKPDFARAARLARQAAGVSQRQLALDLGVQPRQIEDTEHSHKPHAVSLLHVVRGPRVWGLRMIGWAANEHEATVHPLPVVLEEPEAVRTARLTRELLDVPTVATAHLSDGVRDRVEAERELHEVREAIAELLGREALLVAEIRRAR